MKRVLLGILCIFIPFLTVSCDDGVTVNDNCGDGFVDPGEQCDGVNLAGASCENLGHYNVSGQLLCTAGCQFNLEPCGGRCGDQTVDMTDGEECDVDNFNGASCQSLGYGGGQILCTDGCRRDISDCSSICGNGYHETGEDCDDGDTEDGDGCDPVCAVETGWECDNEEDPSACTPICGDGVALDAEPCDGADLKDQTCLSLGYHGGTLACTGDCTLDLASCESAGTCGDGILDTDEGEACDTAAIPADACAEAGYTFGGTPGCTGNCTLDLTPCVRVFSVSAGAAHTCVVVSDGTVWCWGRNDDGQLGAGSTADSATPVQVSTLSNVRSVTSGRAHTCAVLHDGTARCWGSNALGQLGDGTSTSSMVPIQVAGLSTVADLAAGSNHSCAALTDGTVRCWGENVFGQLGDGSTNPHALPAPVSGLSNIHSVVAGNLHSCANDSIGRVFCWGSSLHGVLGDGTLTAHATPMATGTMGSIVRLTSTAYHVCAIDEIGNLWCWGNNESGQCGDGSTTDNLLPEEVGISEAHRVGTGTHMTCVKSNPNLVSCWGKNDRGQLGDGSTVDSLVPVSVGGLTGAADLSSGENHTCAIVNDYGGVACWGANTHGQLGDGTTTDAHSPVAVVAP